MAGFKVGFIMFRIIHCSSAFSWSCVKRKPRLDGRLGAQHRGQHRDEEYNRTERKEIIGRMERGTGW